MGPFFVEKMTPVAPLLHVKNILTLCVDNTTGMIKEIFSDLIALWITMGLLAQTSWRKVGETLKGTQGRLAFGHCHS